MLCRGSGRRQMPCRSPLPAIPSHGTGSGGQLSASCRKRSLAYMAPSKIWCVVVLLQISSEMKICRTIVTLWNGRVVLPMQLCNVMWHIA